MKTIQVYDPPMCCATGICGTDIDPNLLRFVSLLMQLGKQGVKIERYNLGQQPMAFVGNPAVKALLEKEGTGALPVVYWDGEMKIKGRYPDQAEHPDWLRAAREQGTGDAS